MNDAMREAFKRWYNDKMDPRMETYAEDVESHWQAWQAALEHAGRNEVTSDMKAAVMGEFTVQVIVPCLECYYLGPEDDCPDCHGDGQFQIGIEIPWTKCKEIYKAMCAASANTQPPAPAVPERAKNIVEAVCAEVTSRSWRLGDRGCNDRVLDWMSELRAMLVAAPEPPGGDQS